MKTKSSVPATKALQAWQSELRRLEKRLEEWSNELTVREENLERQEAAFEAAVDGASEETIQMYAKSFPSDLPASLPDDEDYQGDVATRSVPIPNIGDEVKWLENLWKLEDSRKKKK